MSKEAEKEPNNSKKNQEKKADSLSPESKENKQKEQEKNTEPELVKDKQVEPLAEKIINLEKEIKILKEKNLRSLADLNNQAKIHSKEINEIIRYGKEKLINQLLFLPDNYERAMQAFQQIEQEDPKQDLAKELRKLESELQKETSLSKKAELEAQKKKIEQ